MYENWSYIRNIVKDVLNQTLLHRVAVRLNVLSVNKYWSVSTSYLSSDKTDLECATFSGLSGMD